jgi:septation ring formation regulator EzrA
MQPYLGEVIYDTAEKKQRLHQEAMANYKRSQAEVAERRAAYDRAVDEYHRQLNEVATVLQAAE